MTEKSPFHLFVVHEFREDAEYARVFEYLESRDNFFYLNYSNPEELPESSAVELLQEAIREQIKHSEVVIVPGGMLARQGGLIDFELVVAQAFNKPIILIQAFGATVALPKNLLDIAAEVVEWNERSIIDAIRRAARGEDTAKWDVVEFDLDDINLDNETGGHTEGNKD
jgi:hypothetical protein